MEPVTNVPAERDADLKPCPFCGGDAEADSQQGFRRIADGETRKAVAIYCTKCTAQVSMCYDDHKEYDPEDLMTILKEAWNVRPAIHSLESQLTQALEAQKTLEDMEREVAAVYCDLTLGKFSKCNTRSDVIINEVRLLFDRECDEKTEALRAQLTQAQAENGEFREYLKTREEELNFEIASERLAGNIVKESSARHALAELRAMKAVIGQSANALLKEVEELRKALQFIADGKTDDYAGNPAKWSSHVAMKALGYTFKDGVVFPPAPPQQPLPPPSEGRKT